MAPRLGLDHDNHVLEQFEGLEGLPEIPPYDEMGRSTRGRLSKTLFERLARACEEGTDEYAYVRNTLVELNLALVKFAASRFRSRSEPMEDIVQVGTIGLIKAIDRFELSRGVEFPTFAMPTIVGEIKRFFRDTSWSVRVPRRLQELRLDLAKAGDELAQRLDRAPTVQRAGRRGCDLAEDEVVEGMAACERLHRELAGRPARGGRHRGRAGRPHRLRGPRPGGRRVRRVPQAADRRAAAARPDDPVAALRRQPDAVRDRRGAGHLADARLPAALPDAGTAAQGADDRGVTEEPDLRPGSDVHRSPPVDGGGSLMRAPVRALPAHTTRTPRCHTAATSGTPGR